nr:GGDEF domain-containing protein [Pseudomonadota bacterium]
MSWQRIRTDFRFAIITLFAAVAVVGITPFAVYRFARGQVVAGVVDVAIVVIISMAGLYVWRGGNIERASRITTVVAGAGCLIVVNLVGPTGVLWMYPVLLANFMLVPRRMALLASAIGILILMLSPGVFTDDAQRIIFVMTASMVSAFSFIFAHRTDTQHTQLENLASHDPLTGIYNRRAMEREMAIAIDAWRRHRTPCGL